MDSPRSDANNQIIVSGVSSKSHEEQGSASIEQGESSESAVAAAGDREDDPPRLENYQLAIVDLHDREYGCRYCSKKFSNKQALGGHQNAHKVERAMEKNVQETGYYDGPNPYPARINMPAPFLTSYINRNPDFLHRSLLSCSGGGGGGGGVVHYNPRPAAEPYAAAGFNSNVYHGWSAPPAPRVPPFPARPHYSLPGGGQNMNIRLPNFGAGSSGAFRPVCNHQGPSGFAGFAIRPGGSNRPAAINLRNVPGNQHDESGLDLSLKLGSSF